MSKPFKNTLCGAGLPDYYGSPPNALRCKRRAMHPPPHRVVFRDGGIREWIDPEKESRLVKAPRKEGE